MTNVAYLEYQENSDLNHILFPQKGNHVICLHNDTNNTYFVII